MPIPSYNSLQNHCKFSYQQHCKHRSSAVRINVHQSEVNLTSVLPSHFKTTSTGKRLINRKIVWCGLVNYSIRQFITSYYSRNILSLIFLLEKEKVRKCPFTIKVKILYKIIKYKKDSVLCSVIGKRCEISPLELHKSLQAKQDIYAVRKGYI